MHDTAYRLGRSFFELYWRDGFRTVLEVGALNVNGTLRDFCPAGASWCGADMAEGPGVDVVLADPHAYPFEDGAFDAVVSSSCLEHDDMFWITFLEMLRVLRPGGFLYINAPSNGWYHAYPQDCWRFYPDAGLALVKWAARMGQDVHLVESFTDRRERDVWNDFVMVFSKDAGAVGTAFLSDAAGVMNVRRGCGGAVLNPSAPTEDMLIQETLRRRLDEATRAGRLHGALDARDRGQS